MTGAMLYPATPSGAAAGSGQWFDGPRARGDHRGWAAPAGDKTARPSVMIWRRKRSVRRRWTPLRVESRNVESPVRRPVAPRPALTAALSALLLLGALLPFFPAFAPAGALAREQEPPRVGLQIGHYRIEELTEDQARLRSQTGGSGGGHREVDVNLAVVQRAAAILAGHGVTVDVLPATVPHGYRADAFVAVHCDASPTGDTGVRGYKLARYRDSVIPAQEDALIEAIGASYGVATGLPRDANVTRAMTGYYAFNQRRFQTIIAVDTPGVIVELGYLTNPDDRAVLVGRTDLVAAALADGIIRFLRASGAALPAPATTPIAPSPMEPLARPAGPPAERVEGRPTPRRHEHLVP